MSRTSHRLFLTFFISMGVMLCGFQEGTRKKQTQPEVLKPIDKFKSHYYDGKTLIMTLASDRMVPLDRDRLQLNGPAATIYHRSKEPGQGMTTIQVSSEKGVFHIASRVIHLQDSVVVKTSDGALLETKALSLDCIRKFSTTDEPFHYKEPGMDLSGTGLELDHESKTLWVKKDVEGRMTGDPRQRASRTGTAQDADVHEILEFRSKDGLRRGPLDDKTALEKKASEKVELSKDVHVFRTQKTKEGDTAEHLSAEYVEFFVHKHSVTEEGKAVKKTEVTELVARERVNLVSSRGGSLSGHELKWNQVEDVVHVAGNPVASGQWEKNTFSGKTIHFDRVTGKLECLEQASARMVPEKEGQSPMTIEADVIHAKVAPAGLVSTDPAAEKGRYALQEFVAEKNVTLTWTAQEKPGEQNPAESEPSRAVGRIFTWDQSLSRGILEDAPYARILQTGNVIESPRIIVYNDPSRVVLKGPKRLTMTRTLPEGQKHYIITSEGDMIMTPAENRIEMLRDVKMVGTDVTLTSESMEVVLTSGKTREIEKLVATGRVHLDNRVQGVKLYGDGLTWNPNASTTVMTGVPYAYAYTPDMDVQAGEIHYDERTGQAEGHGGSQKTIIRIKENPEKKEERQPERKEPQ